MSALVIAASNLEVPDVIRWKRALITPSSSYPAGGEPILPSQLSMRQILGAPAAIDSQGYLWRFDLDNLKLRAYQNGAINLPHAEVTATTDLSGGTFTMLFYGKM